MSVTYNVRRFIKPDATDIRMSEVWRVGVSGPVSILDILALPEIPALNGPYVHPVTGVPNLDWKVTNRAVSPIGDDNRHYEVNVEYKAVEFLSKPKDSASTSVAPWLKKSTITTATLQIDGGIVRTCYGRLRDSEPSEVGAGDFVDHNGDPVNAAFDSALLTPNVPVLNSAGDPFNPPAQRQLFGRRITIETAFEAPPSELSLQEIQNTINSIEIVLRHIWISPLFGKITGVDVSEGTWTDPEDSNSATREHTYYIVKTEIVMHPATHLVPVVDMGYNELVSVTKDGVTSEVKRQITQNTRPITRPAFLNGSGGATDQAKLATNPVIFRYLIDPINAWDLDLFFRAADI